MKSILLIIILNLPSYNSEVCKIRELYLNASRSEARCDQLGAKLNTLDVKNSVLLKGYAGCFYFIKCKFINSPSKKLLFFNKGKSLIESAIKEDPLSVELRFLRFSIQKNLPRFLLYNNDIEKDLNFVTENIQRVKNKESQKFIIKSLKSINK
tara:strand:- start:22839 stop:23297 length:459 start_codon:yes stop_codon:yes gene_type:complete